MKMKAYKDIQLSRLGMGCMRLPLNGPKDTDIDVEKAQAIIDYAMANGINYFDTAYVYHTFNSEKFMGNAMKKYPRDSYYLATKYFIGAEPDYRACFEKQLENLQTDHIDFYLVHCLTDGNLQQYLDSGCIAYFAEQKKLGRITHLGFSTHASVATTKLFLDQYDWDFVQIQLNYYDWLFSTAKEEYELLTERGIPVMVMEPVRGGRLATLNEESNARLKAVEPDMSIASWAMRWVSSLPNVQVVLSGMTTMEQIVDNVNTFSNSEPLNDEQEALLLEVCRDYRKQVTVACTACRYCTDGCPMEIDIPKMMEIMNNYKINGPRALSALNQVEEGKRPADCIGCGACTSHCPQSIDIPAVMAELAEAAK